MDRVFVYVASPDWELNVYTSIHSLVSSGNEFDLIKIFSVGGEMKRIKKISPKVEVVCVKNRNKNYFARNKYYVTKQRKGEIVYLDADTVILGNIKEIIKNYNKKIIIKKDSQNSVKRALKNMGVKSEWVDEMGESILNYDLYNTGFFALRNGCIGKMEKVWRNLENVDKNICYNKKGVRRVTEQIKFSISVKREIGEVGLMSENHHVYGWEKSPGEVGEDAIVYHTGSRGGRHLKYASAVARGRDLSFNTPLISSATHPLFLKLQAYDLGYRVKHFFKGIGG